MNGPCFVAASCSAVLLSITWWWRVCAREGSGSDSALLCRWRGHHTVNRTVEEKKILYIHRGTDSEELPRRVYLSSWLPLDPRRPPFFPLWLLPFPSISSFIFSFPGRFSCYFHSLKNEVGAALRQVRTNVWKCDCPFTSGDDILQAEIRTGLKYSALRTIQCRKTQDSLCVIQGHIQPYINILGLLVSDSPKLQLPTKGMLQWVTQYNIKEWF